MVEDISDLETGFFLETYVFFAQQQKIWALMITYLTLTILR